MRKNHVYELCTMQDGEIRHVHLKTDSRAAIVRAYKQARERLYVRIRVDGRVLLIHEAEKLCAGTLHLEGRSVGEHKQGGKPILTKEKADEIRAIKAENPKITQRALAAAYGVSQRCIADVLKKKTWTEEEK